MQIKHYLPWIFSSILIALILWLSFKLVDQSVAIDNQVQFSNGLAEQRNMLLEILTKEMIGRSESDVRKMLTSIIGQTVIDKESGEIVAAQVSFLFKDGLLNKIEFENP